MRYCRLELAKLVIPGGHLSYIDLTLITLEKYVLSSSVTEAGTKLQEAWKVRKEGDEKSHKAAFFQTNEPVDSFVYRRTAYTQIKNQDFWGPPNEVRCENSIVTFKANFQI